jgi:branched-chain amino acid transport system ATP-binding protein
MLSQSRPQGGDDMDTLLSVRNLCRSFGGLAVTQDVSLDIAPGAQEAIIGPNGAGKSTFFNLLTGYHRPSSGSIFFDGTEVSRMPPHLIVRRGMARAFQVANIFVRMTVFENIRCAVQSHMGRTLDLLGSAERPGAERTREILEMCRLSDRADVNAASLSQGDRKKLELALALASRPKLLLLDEPTAGMSLEETHETMNVVDDLNQRLGIAILFTEHDMSVVFNHARRISVLHRGKIVAQGLPDDIRNDEYAQEIYFGEQV